MHKIHGRKANKKEEICNKTIHQYTEKKIFKYLNGKYKRKARLYSKQRK